MPDFIATIAIGIVCIALGILNMSGNVSTLHRYHRHRVAEEDMLPFAKKVGLGTIICGVGVLLFGIFSAIAQFGGNSLVTTVGIVFMIVGIVAGLGLSFYAMIKYNKGIF